MTREVVIVGAGPVGLVLAAELLACDVDVLVLEREPVPDTRLRAPAITERTIEALERHGVLDRIAGASERYRAAHGATSATLPPDLRVDGVRTLPVRQDQVEVVLDEHVRACGGELRRRCELVGLTQRDDGVELRVSGPGAAGEQVLHARYVVGCDGGRSTVRRAVGIGFSGQPATLTGYQAEVEIHDPGVLRRGWCHSARGIAAYELCPSRVVSVEFGAPPVDRAAPVTLEEVQASLRRTSASGVTLTRARSLTRFTDNERLADAYRRGRVVLAGDAAHVHAPFGGQGLNLGVQDAVNLGWKLAATLRGRAVDGLLDSYERERRPVAEQVLRNVRTAISLMGPDPRIEPARELVEELRGLDTVRRHMHEKTAMTGVRYDVGPDADEPLLGRAPHGLRLDRDGSVVELSQVARPGRGLLLVLRPAGARIAATAAAWRDRVDVVAASVAAPADTISATTGAAGLGALLLRPDGHVVWLARDDGRASPSALRDVLARVFGPPVRADRTPATTPPTRSARPRGAIATVPDDVIDALEGDGHAVLPEFLTAAELAACRRELREQFPTCDELLEDPDRFTGLRHAAFFPYAGATLNHATTHPALIDLVERVLAADDVRIGDAVLQARYGRLADAGASAGREQALHHEAWEGASLVYPAEDGVFRRIFATVFLTDVTAQLAPTYVVPRRFTDGLALVTAAGLASYPREDYPWLYDAERPIVAPAGSALLTTGRTILRDSVMTAARGERFSLFVNFHSAAASWQRSRTFVSLPGAPEGPAARRFMAGATPKQRQLFGFPPPGHAYWTGATLRGIAGIYPDLDLTPYADAPPAGDRAPSSTAARR